MVLGGLGEVKDVAALEAVIGPTLTGFGYSLAGKSGALAPLVAARMLESDTITNPENVDYRRKHEEGRKKRREQGVWRDEDRDSLLWSMN